MTGKQKRAEEITALRTQLATAKASQTHNYHFADASISRTSTDMLEESGVVISVRALNGTELIPDVMIPDGLSDNTIEALRADFRRAYLRMTELKPKGV